MTTAITLLLAAVLITAFVYVVVMLIKGRLKYRGEMRVTCPETGQPVGVKVEGKSAAISTLVGKDVLHLSDCSRWPERQDCGQECLHQIEQSPEDCMVLHILERWYRGKACYFCRKVFDDIHWHDHKPGLRNPAGELVEWPDVEVEKLHEVLESHEPVTSGAGNRAARKNLMC